MREERLEVGELWRSVNREMHLFMRRVFQGGELPFMALVLLRHINREPGVSLVELARRSDSAKSHVSKMIEHLERQGFVEKRPDPDDQRLVRLHLTKAARDVMAETEARAQEAWSRVVDEVPEGQLDDVMRGLRILMGALETLNRKDGQV